jgi:hypothetical protein
MFFVALIAFVGFWLMFHFRYGFDKDFGELNMMLSIEASVSLAFFTMLGDAQAAYQRTQTDYQKQMVEDVQRLGRATLSIAEGQRDILSDHIVMLRDLRENDSRMLQRLEAILEKHDGH